MRSQEEILEAMNSYEYWKEKIRMVPETAMVAPASQEGNTNSEGPKCLYLLDEIARAITELENALAPVLASLREKTLGPVEEAEPESELVHGLRIQHSRLIILGERLDL